MSEHAHDIQKEVKRYIAVFVALLVLTMVTVAASYLRLNIVGAVTLALMIATVKASLVACYFMHLISEKKMIYLILGFTVIFFLGLLFLPFWESLSVPEGTVHVS